MLIQPWSWLYLVCVLDFLGASMIMPVFSSHLRSVGLSHASVGLLSSVYGASQLLSGPIVGSWSDVNGRRQVLCVSMIICAIAYGLMGAASSFYSFLFLRSILGSFKHTQTLCRAFIADIVPTGEQASVQGRMNAFTSFAFMVGPLISGHVMDMKNGFQYLTLSVFLIFVLNATLVFLLAHNVDNYRKDNKISNKSNNSVFEKFTLVFKELYSIDWKQFWTLFSIKFLFALSSLTFFQNLGIILTEGFEVTTRFMGYTISFYGLVSAVSNLYMGKIKSMWFMPKTFLKTLMYTFTLMAVTFFLLFLVHHEVFFIVGLIPLSSSNALTRILMMEVLLNQSDVGHRGSVVGASSSVASIARTLAPALSGLVISRWGVPSVLLLSSVAAASACFLSVICSRQVHEKVS